MLTGKVKFFNKSKGFGFIIDDETGEEIFVHVTEVKGPELNQDDLVTYDTKEHKKGVQAKDVRKIA